MAHLFVIERGYDYCSLDLTHSGFCTVVQSQRHDTRKILPSGVINRNHHQFNSIQFNSFIHGKTGNSPPSSVFIITSSPPFTSIGHSSPSLVLISTLRTPSLLWASKSLVPELDSPPSTIPTMLIFPEMPADTDATVAKVVTRAALLVRMTLNLDLLNRIEA